MKHSRLLCLVSMITLTGGCKAEAVRGNLADMLIIDRDNGAVLTPYLYHGEYWIAGRPGSRYAIEIRNHLGERLLVVMSVDGVNVVSGATAAWDQNGYVFSPGDQYQVTGWRKSDTEIAAFTFTESPNSYAERTGHITTHTIRRKGDDFGIHRTCVRRRPRRSDVETRRGTRRHPQAASHARTWSRRQCTRRRRSHRIAVSRP